MRAAAFLQRLVRSHSSQTLSLWFFSRFVQDDGQVFSISICRCWVQTKLLSLITIIFSYRLGVLFWFPSLLATEPETSASEVLELLHLLFQEPRWEVPAFVRAQQAYKARRPKAGAGKAARGVNCFFLCVLFRFQVIFRLFWPYIFLPKIYMKLKNLFRNPFWGFLRKNFGCIFLLGFLSKSKEWGGVMRRGKGYLRRQ